jgi:hypothetical protein
VVNSLGAGAPVASTLQYLQRALQAPVALQEVISKGPLSVKLKPLKLSSVIHSFTLEFSRTKKDYAFHPASAFPFGSSTFQSLMACGCCKPEWCSVRFIVGLNLTAIRGENEVMQIIILSLKLRG